jgi:hypothetical protein
LGLSFQLAKFDAILFSGTTSTTTIHVLNRIYKRPASSKSTGVCIALSQDAYLPCSQWLLENNSSRLKSVGINTRAFLSLSNDIGGIGTQLIASPNPTIWDIF